jgi:hypothetical protein
MVVGNASGHGAVTFDSNARITMTNNVVAQNLGGVYVRGSAAFPFVGELAHNTIAQNVTNGVYVGWWYGAESTSLTMTNNIIVSHTTGVYVYDDPTNQVTATHTLLFGNATDSGGGTVLSTNEITGSAPRFVDPPGRDYHILVGSPAIDAGTPVPWLQTDIDGNPRPIGARYDIGADEFPWRVTHLPLVVRNAQP